MNRKRIAQGMVGLMLVLCVLGVALLASRRGTVAHKPLVNYVSYHAVEILHLALKYNAADQGKLEFNSGFTRTGGRLAQVMSYWTISSPDGGTKLHLALTLPSTRVAREFKTVHGSVWAFVLHESSDMPSVLSMLKVPSLDAWFQQLQQVERDFLRPSEL